MDSLLIYFTIISGVVATIQALIWVNYYRLGVPFLKILTVVISGSVLSFYWLLAYFFVMIIIMHKHAFNINISQQTFSFFMFVVWVTGWIYHSWDSLKDLNKADNS
jgi:hypothetical protein